LAAVSAVTFGTATRLFEGRGRLHVWEGNLVLPSLCSTANDAARFLLAAQTEAADQFVVFLNINAFEVIKHTASLRDHLEQSAPRVMIFFVRFEVLGELVNPIGEQRDLHLRRPCVALMSLIRRNDLFFCFSI